ncbi:hypothetical protein PEPS_18290 [Persicobacter psychrovividus]|uniref:DNA alkylation repair protein n=2 Tax=Persicobacter psychrovividus TaxID=387638 RepID=A0ABM7VF24_9BACT|nr:hypothetical protein PEPS_18290 [Persicobacter psychrovividus]
MLTFIFQPPLQPMNYDQVFEALEQFGSEQTRKVLRRHGAKAPFFGVKVQDLKKIQKKIKRNHSLALDLYASGNSDAMYLAGLIAEPQKMSREQLQQWAEQAYWYMLSEYCVAPVTSASPFAMELAEEWIEAQKEHLQAAGWTTYANYLSFQADSEIDLDRVQELIQLAEQRVHLKDNRAAYAMNNFVIAAGTFCAPLFDTALKVGAQIGKVKVNMGETSCKVPEIVPYLLKVKARDKVGKKTKRPNG